MDDQRTGTEHQRLQQPDIHPGIQHRICIPTRRKRDRVYSGENREVPVQLLDGHDQKHHHRGGSGYASPPAQEESATAANSEPVPAGVQISTDAVAVAKIEDGLQTVKIELTDDGPKPAIVVLQAEVDTEWTIKNTSSRPGNAALLFPAYYTQFPMEQGETPLYLYPTESFDFSTKDNKFYGYVKVVEDIQNIDIEAIKEEAGSYQTMIWPSSYFEPDSAAASCCG